MKIFRELGVFIVIDIELFVFVLIKHRLLAGQGPAITAFPCVPLRVPLRTLRAEKSSINMRGHLRPGYSFRNIFRFNDLYITQSSRGAAEFRFRIGRDGGGAVGRGSLFVLALQAAGEWR
ncbi:MAG: hypothetical protein Q4G68_14360 [Planctomycetia bacterium]|nr:hypothetical protein [Planctomycetia bacterium]